MDIRNEKTCKKLIKKIKIMIKRHTNWKPFFRINEIIHIVNFLCKLKNMFFNERQH